MQPDGLLELKRMIISTRPFSTQCFRWRSWPTICTTMSTHGCWQAKTRTDAFALLKAITDFDFIVTYLIAYSLLSQMTGLTVKLQKKTNDIYKAFAMVSEVKTYRNIRTNFRAQFDAIYDLTVEMTENVGILPSVTSLLVVYY